MSDINSKIISSLYKCMPSDRVADYPALDALYVWRGQRVSLQLIYRDDGELRRRHLKLRPVFSGELAEYVTVRTVEYLPSMMPAYANCVDEGYISHDPGIFPDLLLPLRYHGQLAVISARLRSLFIEVAIPEGIEVSKESSLTVSLVDQEGEERSAASVKIFTSKDALPASDVHATHWFHCDCLASYYNVPIFSDRHFEIIENYMKVAASRGLDTILTPIHTPPLDTYRGGERPTIQLVAVRRSASGEYSFDLTNLDRYIDAALRSGIKCFEFSHLFTQQGASNAPKIVADVESEDGTVETRRIFGWETNGLDPEYTGFLNQYVTAIKEHMASRGLADRCFWHISDEPQEDHIDDYSAACASLADALKGCTRLDALSSLEISRRAGLDLPVVSTDHAMPFVEAGASNMWVYYACFPHEYAANRFFATPGHRTRVLGAQMYKYNIRGFLQWGYNFWYNQGSYDLVNPYVITDADGFGPSGDASEVYPAPDGTAYESIRLVHTFEAMQDIQILKLCEAKLGRERVLAELERDLSEPLIFLRCPDSYEYIDALIKRLWLLCNE